jgi:hypothetical protein
VVQVSATITYTDKDGNDQKIIEFVKLEKSKNKLTDAEKQARKVKEAKRIIRETITALKRAGAETRVSAFLADSLSFPHKPTT